MACSCGNTSFSSFAGASSSTCVSSSSSSSSYSSSPSSLSFLHHEHRMPSTKQALLRLDCEKIKHKLCFAVAAKKAQGQHDKPKNTAQRGGGRSAGVAVKEEKASWKGGNTGGKNPKSYSEKPNPISSENSKFRSHSGGRTGSRLFSNNDEDEEEDEDDFDEEEEGFVSGEEGYTELPIMPIPPAGFVLAEDGSVSIMAPPHKRVTTLVDNVTKLPLDCLIRRVFSSSDGRQCFLLCPLDTPVQILRIEDGDVLKEISDEELEDVFPTASYELAKRRLHLIQSGYCLTLRGGFCFSEEDVIDLDTVYGESGEGDRSLNEGVEVASFLWNDSEYLLFTPVDPLMFVSYKDNKTGELLIADDDLLEDEAVLDAIDEEKEFQAYMEEENLIIDEEDEEKE